jgi:two-component system, NarL family, sensor kinase
VVHDLRPPALDDLGLLGALRQQAKLLDAETLTVTARGGELERLPAGVEVAAYRIASELLGHCASDAAGCELVLELFETRLLIEAAVASAPEEFLDLVRHQAVEVGGRLEVGPSGRVRVVLPVRRSS